MLKNEKVEIIILDGIMKVIGTDTLINIETAQEVVNYRLQVSNGKKYPLLSDLRIVKKIDKDAREFLGSEIGSEGVIAAAVLMNSKIGAMIFNFFLRLNKPIVTTKLFTEEESAMKWLSQYVQN